ncbi:MAG: TAXI family TRAP transporter solute-binding subunit [Clostridia bacterium]|nr:TAXI family TRAP transporter solute-binding subunit [Clostridia bacterium]MBR6741269.1 TAXI family TRAP transporter solute-binding subunit [Clostridia bacterium]
MKKILSALMVVALVFALVACAGSTTMTMGTGSPTGTYYAYGGIIGQYIKNNAGIAVNAVSTGGSKDNIQGIDSGDYQLGTVQSDVMDYAWNGTRSFEEDGKIDTFRTVAGLYAEAVQLVTTNADIKSVADLKDKKVSIGAPGSGVYFNAMDVLAAAGLTEKDIKPQYQNFDESADALKNGQIDAAFIVAGAPTPAITELSMTNSKVRIVPIDGAIAQKLMKDNTFYSVYKIPADTYSNQKEEVLTVTVKATLIVNADANEDEVYKLTAAIFDNTEAIAKEHAKGAELSLENATDGMTVPFHAGAAKYFKEKGIEVAVQ